MSPITPLSWLCGDNCQAIAQERKPQERPASRWAKGSEVRLWSLSAQGRAPERRESQRERPPKEPLKLQLQIEPCTLSEEEMRREVPKRETCSNHQRPHKDESSSRSSRPGWQTSRDLEYWVFGHSGSYLSGRFTRASHQGLLAPTSLKVSLKGARLLTSSLTASENNSRNTQHLAKANLWCLVSDK